MPTDQILEQRVTDVEAAIEAIQKRLAIHPPFQTSDWVERFTGSFKDEPAFAEVIAYGKAIREADHSRLLKNDTDHISVIQLL
jgi:hypothetical protein